MVLLTVSQAAERLGLDRNTLYAHLRSEGPTINGITFAIRISGRWRIPSGALDRVLACETGDWVSSQQNDTPSASREIDPDALLRALAVPGVASKVLTLLLEPLGLALVKR
jgi:hypothetical protein